MTIPATQPTVTEGVRMRRKEIRRIIREELPGLLNAAAVRRLAQKIEEGTR